MIGLSASFANTFVCFGWKDKLIGFPEIAVALATFVGCWDLLPQFAAGRLASVSNRKRHDLACPAAHHCPQPAFVPFFLDKRPHFICFQDIVSLGRQERLFKFRIGLVFFLARRPTSDGSRRTCVECLAYWSVRSRPTRSAPFVLQCSHVWVPTHHVFHSLCTSIADFHWHYDRF